MPSYDMIRWFQVCTKGMHVVIISDMISREELVELVNDAYNHLYDLVYLRTHALGSLLFPDLNQNIKERSLKLHHLLLDVIKELNPGPNAPISSPEWRRYRLMDLRFIQGLDTQSVADQLFISRRHLYREQLLCMDACAEIVKGRISSLNVVEVSNLEQSPSTENRLKMLQLEPAQSLREQVVDANEVIQQTYTLISNLVLQKGLIFNFDLSPNLPNANIERNVLRQAIMGIFNSILINRQSGDVWVSSKSAESSVVLSFKTRCSQDNFSEEGLKTLCELAEANKFEFSTQVSPEGETTFSVVLPSSPKQTIILADDNEDMRRLIHSYLHLLYTVIETSSGAEVVRLVHENQPFAVILDLMMPEMDGWEVLQRLVNNNKTAHIPIIVCSVLSMKELALSLGAAAFLPKPFSEAELLHVLRSLD